MSVVDSKIQQMLVDIQKLHDIVHGDQYAEVSTVNGAVPSFAKLQADNVGAIIAAAVGYRDAALGAASDASTASGAAVTAKNLAEAWADAGVGVEVVTGKFSARHWAQQAAASILNRVVFRGNWSAAGGTYPAPADAAYAGDMYKVSVAGTVGGVSFAVGDAIIYEGAAGTWFKQTAPTNPTEVIPIALGDEVTAITTGVGKVTWHVPYSTGFVVTKVLIGLTTPQTSGALLTVDMKEAGVSIFSTLPTINNGADTSAAAATPAVISDGNLAAYAKMTIDIPQIGDGTAKGAKVYVIGHKP
jgi:hypothetical protein